MSTAAIQSEIQPCSQCKIEKYMQLTLDQRDPLYWVWLCPIAYTK